MEEKLNTAISPEEFARVTQENAQLRAIVSEYESRLRKLSEMRAMQRIEFLFKVLDNSLHFSTETVDKVVKEIEEAFGFSSENKEEETNETDN